MNSKIQEQSILKSSFYTMSMGVVGKLFGFVSTLLTAYFFGANTKTDIIFFACLIIFSLSALFSSYNSNILLPQLVKSSDQEKEVLINYSFTKLFLYLLVSCAFILYFHLEFFALLSKFDSIQLKSSQLSILLLLPILLLQPLVDLMINVAQSFKNYNLSNLSSLLVGICNISCLLLFSSQLQENSLALGFFIAFVIQFFLFYLYLYKKGIHPKFSLKKPNNNEAITSLLLPTILLQIVSSILLVLPDFFASSLNEGTLTLMSYGKRIFDLIPTLFIYPIVLVFYPRICEWQNQNNLKNLKSKLLQLIKLFFLSLFPCALFLLTYSSDIIELLFFKAKLNQSQLNIASNCLFLLTLNTPAFIISSLSGRLIAASQTKKAFYFQLLIQTLGALFLVGLISYFIEEYNYLAILYGLLIYHLLYSQLSNIILIKNLVVDFSIFHFIVIEVVFCILPIILAYFSYKIKIYSDNPFYMILSVLFFGASNLCVFGLYYKTNKEKLADLLKS